MILSINFAILTCFKFFVHFFETFMKIFLFFLEGNKNCRVGTKNRVGRVSGNTGIL